MTREQAIQKVLKCLRLAASSNPNEAATALRHARKLMEEFGLTEADAHAATFAEGTSKTRCRGVMLPNSLCCLVETIADGFGCMPLVQKRPGATVVLFFGRPADATIAAYAFEVMRRQLDADRIKHTARIRKRANKAARGEHFALGWVVAVRALFPVADATDDSHQALAAAYRARFPAAREASARKVGAGGKVSPDDYGRGWHAGKQARYAAGVAGAGQARLEHRS